MKFNLVIILSVLQFCAIIGLSTSFIAHCNLINYNQGLLNCYNFRKADINKFNPLKIPSETENEFNPLQHTPPKINVNIKHLTFFNCHFDFFTTRFFGNFYGSLIQISAYNCGISDIIDKTFWTVPNLTHLDLQLNAIKELRSKSFYNLKQLQEVNLKDNLIERIEPDTFENLTSLETIHLDNNKLKFISSNTFKMINNIKFLYLQNNPMNGELVLNFNKIEKLIAYNCSLTCFSMSVNSGEIQELSLDRNNLKEIVLPNIKVKELDLSHNKITRLDKINGSELKVLNLDGNPLDHDNIQNDFHNMAKLVTLSLVNTNLRKLNKDMFKSMSNLKYLDISKNPLEKEKELEAIKEIPNLKDCTITWPTVFNYNIGFL